MEYRSCTLDHILDRDFGALYPAEAPVLPTLNSQIGAQVLVDIFSSLPWLGADAKAQDRSTKAGAANLPGSSSTGGAVSAAERAP
eukprot:5863247-Pyramimonas_sp.AAC.1